MVFVNLINKLMCMRKCVVFLNKLFFLATTVSCLIHFSVSNHGYLSEITNLSRFNK